VVSQEDLDILARRVTEAVAAVPDPELGGVCIGGLGLVVSVDVVPVVVEPIDGLGLVGPEHASSSEVGDVELVVSLTPTFLGCPALSLIANDVTQAALAAGAASVRVIWVHEPVWTYERISEEARNQLAQLGIAVPRTAPDGAAVVDACPTCGSADLLPAAPVGSTSCRSVSWCRGCRSVIEIMRGSYAHV
jgi:ring-1,2-phenylacetyl-CoA epoxidase subunit PaaD